MPDQGHAWEYCQLSLSGSEKQGEVWLFNLAIRYFGDGKGAYLLSEKKGKRRREWDYNPWEKAIALLGTAGWELVMVQHANLAGDMGGGGTVAWEDCIAYFKRPVLPGRSIYEPKLELP
jgi:hypothetical protein